MDWLGWLLLGVFIWWLIARTKRRSAPPATATDTGAPADYLSSAAVSLAYVKAVSNASCAGPNPTRPTPGRRSDLPDASNEHDAEPVDTGQNVEQQPRGGGDHPARFHEHHHGGSRRHHGQVEHTLVVYRLDQPHLRLKLQPQVQSVLIWTFMLREQFTARAHHHPELGHGARRADVLHDPLATITDVLSDLHSCRSRRCPNPPDERHIRTLPAALVRETAPRRRRHPRSKPRDQETELKVSELRSRSRPPAPTYQRMVTAYREPDRTRGRALIRAHRIAEPRCPARPGRARHPRADILTSAPPTSWLTSTAPAPAPVRPRRSTAASKTYATPPSASALNYTLDWDEPFYVTQSRPL